MERLMTNIVTGLALVFLVSSTGRGQDVKVPDQIEKLSVRAKETINITLDGPLLQLAGQFLNSKSAEDRRVKDVISGVKAIHLRSFEFDTAGGYSDADVAAYRSQLRSPAWSRIVDTVNRDEREHVEVFVKQEKGRVAGVAIIAAEPKELTIVNIDGTIDLAHLTALGGQFGIPKIDASAGH
jgi:Domain of unknown function (DUF4252)